MIKKLLVALGLLLITTSAFASTAALFTPAKLGLTVAGDSTELLTSGSVYLFASDGTTPATGWTTSSKSATLPQPVPLNAYGQATIYLDGTYTLKIYDSDGVLQNTLLDTFVVDGLNTLSLSSQLLLVSGNVSAPALSFTGDTNTGLYLSAADELSVAAGGAQSVKFRTTGLVIPTGNTIDAVDINARHIDYGWSTGTAAGSPYTPGTETYIIRTSNGSGNTTTINIPTAVGNEGREYTIINKTIIGGATIVLVPYSGENISGYSSVPMHNIGEILTLASNGTNWLIKSWTGATQSAPAFLLLGGNGHGSDSNNKIRRFTTPSTVPNYLTYTDSTTAGGSMTLLTPGIYSAVYSDQSVTTSIRFGITKNDVALTSFIYSLADSTRLSMSQTSGANNNNSCSATFYADAGDVIRAHTDGSADGTSNNFVFFRLELVKPGN